MRIPVSSRLIHIYAIVACFISVATDLIMAVFLNKQSLLTSTISDLAAGDFDLAQDIGLCLVALAIALTGLNVWRTETHNWQNGVAAGLLALAGPLIVLISLYEAYSESNPDGPLIHYWVVGAIGFSISIALALLAWTHGRDKPFFRWATALAAFIFLAAGAATFGVSNEIIGLVERLAAVSLVAWLLGFHGTRLLTDS
ncbi:DUF998 domain-containing protein [Henriciella marina]|uniref:DUF998 domain-containing protein n=1 Tax=Henriciella marina TaxID=453851 RepID=UPI000685DCAC|nr:DUF998 domain-containing protein [Henriciella marina]